MNMHETRARARASERDREGARGAEMHPLSRTSPARFCFSIIIAFCAEGGRRDGA